jgi:homocysteine S-methyltransferase
VVALMPDRLGEIVRAQGFVVLDGGLATTLEAMGADLDDPLWSAKLLLDSPALVRRAHEEFLVAGADCIATATYQATHEGFRRRGLSGEQGTALMELAVTLACEARDAFLRRLPAGRPAPLVAASLGPYGAFLADGGEYRGDYGLGEQELFAFHRPRWQVLALGPADLLACETIPSLPETHALLRLLDETPGVHAWISFSCRDAETLWDGGSLVEAVRACDARANLAAVGVNCTAPSRIAPLVRVLRENSRKPVLVYPNSGEAWDATRKAWSGTLPSGDWVEAAPEWVRLGATGVGGCCRTGPEEIARLRRILEATRC